MIIFWSCLTILCAALSMVAAYWLGVALFKAGNGAYHFYIHRTHKGLYCPECQELSMAVRPMGHRRI